MSRAPGGFSMNDLKSSAILQEFIVTTNPCAPGNEVRQRCKSSKLIECGAPPYGFDRNRDFIVILGGMVLVATVIGILHSWALFISVVQKEYELGIIEVCFTAALTYAVVIKTACLGCIFIQYSGHRATASAGMIFVFIGTLLDSQVLHYSVYYIANIIFVGIGGGLAYSSAMCLPGELFRKRLLVGMILMSISGCIGTIIFYWFTLFLITHVSYKWTKLTLALIVLLLTGAATVLPCFRVNDCSISSSKNPSHKDRNADIKDCVEKAAQRDRAKNPPNNDQKSCLCVCVCDMSLWSDWSFLLWAVCILVATMAMYIPYMFIIAYAENIGVELSPFYITLLCVGSVIGRTIILFNNDHTYSFNRNLFMGAVIASGVFWILLEWVETFGWVLVWCVVMGGIEGVLVIVIPRLTLATIPRRWIEHSWGYILWFHAFGIFMITVFVAVVGREVMEFFVAFVAIGIPQIICGILAVLLPNEEGCDDEIGTGLGPPRPYQPRAFSPFSPCPPGPFLQRFTSTAPQANLDYQCGCPICSQIGCIPECKDCTPGEFAPGMQPCNPNINTSGFGGVSPPNRDSANVPNMKPPESNTRMASTESKSILKPTSSHLTKAPPETKSKYLIPNPRYTGAPIKTGPQSRPSGLPQPISSTPVSDANGPNSTSSRPILSSNPPNNFVRDPTSIPNYSAPMKNMPTAVVGPTANSTSPGPNSTGPDRTSKPDNNATLMEKETTSTHTQPTQTVMEYPGPIDDEMMVKKTTFNIHREKRKTQPQPGSVQAL